MLGGGGGEEGEEGGVSPSLNLNYAGPASQPAQSGYQQPNRVKLLLVCLLLLSAARVTEEAVTGRGRWGGREGEEC